MSNVKYPLLRQSPFVRKVQERDYLAAYQGRNAVKCWIRNKSCGVVTAS